MKLRNKKTSDIIDVCIIVNHKEYRSIEELYEDYEDYTPAEPLIKDEKIRKAVRVWAEANELEPDYEVRYSENTFSLISWQACIEFNTQIDGLEHDKKYTIAELCGEEE
jgi:hypothetical protein